MRIPYLCHLALHFSGQDYEYLQQKKIMNDNKNPVTTSNSFYNCMLPLVVSSYYVISSLVLYARQTTNTAQVSR